MALEMEPSLTAVGVPIGPAFADSDVDYWSASARVRFGPAWVTLPLLFYRVWLQFLVPTTRAQGVAHLVASGLGGSLDEHWPTLVGETRASGDGDPVDLVVDVLVERGLLVELPSPPPVPEAFLRRYRIKSLGTGIGNEPGEPAVFRVGSLGAEPLVLTNTLSYSVWASSRAGISLWDTCAEVAALSGPTDEFEVRTCILAVLPLMLEANVARLEPVEAPGIGG
ncbi:MAG: hypothetical protein ACYDGR_00625 [Candidatus Dormibacteria bacterium]